MLFRELNRGKCKTYLIGSEKEHLAVLVDPVREKVDRYLALLAYQGMRLEAVIDTHTHADHRSASVDLKELIGAKVIMHSKAPAPHVTVHVDDGEEIPVGDLHLKVLYTPGHTPDGISLFIEDRVLTGDTLLIRGTGRCDFAGGDAGEQFDAITQKLFALPDATLVFPAHDYPGNRRSTIGDEKRLNPRVVGRTREQYIELMNNLGLPLPDNIQEVLQPNQSAVDDDRLRYPTLAELNQVRQLTSNQVRLLNESPTGPIILDVREPEEYTGELGHISGSQLIPLKDLTARAEELEKYKDRHIIVVCRAGIRSTTAAAILTGLGFEHVSNLKGGMLDWNKNNFVAERNAPSAS
ncbi:MAG TPA: MBL fold metallo-hydrolase [Candidatus Binatia bacterium]|jgi:glyoxylase-like metal-dependent hydrolase (beta-lactamase superfamily II)/rhodanese-related sulfurtransferase